MTTIKVRPNISSPFVTLGVAPTMAYTTDLGAVTGGTPVTVTHNLGTYDVVVQVVEKDTAAAGAAAGQVVDAFATIEDANSITLEFAENAAANLYRVTVLAVGGTVGVSPNLIDAKGDLIVGSAADTAARLAVGTNDYALIADSVATNGAAWKPVVPWGRKVTVIGSECIYPDGLAGTADQSGDWDGFRILLDLTGAASGTTEAGRMGIIQVSSGTNAAGRCGIASPANMISAGYGRLRFESVIKIPTLSDGTNTFTVHTGLGNAVGAVIQTDGALFRYSHGTNSGKWQIVTATGSAENAQDSGVTANTGWHHFALEVNANRTSVEFFIDGTSVGSSASLIPNSGMRVMPVNIIKSAGATARTAQLDMFSLIHEFTTSR